MKSMIAAQRILYAVSPDGVGRELALSVEIPIEKNDGSWCAKVLIGFIDPVLTISGVDAWQAVQLSMLMVATRVGRYEKDGWKFYWEKDGDRAYAADLATDPNLPIPEKTSNYEASTEETPFTPEQNAIFKQLTLDRSATTLLKFDNSESDEKTFVHLPQAAAAAYHLDRFEDAKIFAEKALRLAPLFRENWNSGNAIHLGRTILGLLAVQRNDILDAIDELIKSGETLGSPQLKSFGPTMQLAKELLKRDQAEPVLAYLNQCRKFWKMGDAWLDVWGNKILAGEIPNFFQHSYA